MEDIASVATEKKQSHISNHLKYNVLGDWNMAIFFLQEIKELNKYKLKKNNILNKIEEEIHEDKVLLNLPIQENAKLKKIIKLVNKLEKYNIKTAVLSNKLNKIENLKNVLYSRNINILNGTHLFKLLIEDVVNYICEECNRKIEKTEISILTNEASNLNKEIIIRFAEKVKTLNIITNHIEQFKNLEDYLYNEKGIIIKLSNNYKTALQNTNIIINMDFPEEIINKYLLPNKCIIVNMRAQIKIKSKRFNGININDYNIIMPEKYKIDRFSSKLIYESFVLDKDYKQARKQILEDKIEIEELIGEKGVINQKEYKINVIVL